MGAFATDESNSLTCNTEKDKHVRLNHRTAGILAGMRPRGVIVVLSEVFIAESISQVYGCLHNYFAKYPNAAKETEYVCYDDACHLRRFARNPVRTEITDQTKHLARVEKVVDKFHMKGHVDSWCHNNCEAKKFPDLDKVDKEVCEHVFSWLSKYRKTTQKMSQHTFVFLLLHPCDLHNSREELKVTRGSFM